MGLKNTWDNFLLSTSKYTLGDKPFREIITKISYFLVLLIVIPLLFATGDSVRYTDVKIGSVATKKVVAPFNFFILKTDAELEADRNQAVSKVPYYFNFNKDILQKQQRLLTNSLNFIKQSHISRYDTLNANALTSATTLTSVLLDSFNIMLNPAQLLSFKSIFAKKESMQNLNHMLQLVRAKAKTGILDVDPQTLKRDQIAYKIGDVEEIINKNEKKDILTVLQEIEDESKNLFSSRQARAFNKYISQVIKPDLIFAQKETDEAVDRAISAVSLTKDMVYENERIVDANERINEEIYQKLYSLEYARIERSKREGNWQPIFAQVGKIMLLASILFIVGLYLFSFRKKIFMDNRKLLLITIIILLQLIIAAIIAGPLNWPVYLIPTTIASMLLAILIDSGIAFVVTAAIALIFGGIQGGGYDITLFTLVGGMVAIYAVHEIRNRNQIFKAILYIALSYAWVLSAITFLRFDSLENLGKIFAFYLLPNAMFAPFFTYMVLGAFEKLFDITTDVRLLELSDLNHPLLKVLSLKAPGTFHHSMVVGNLAEAAAKEIGENSLLTRVGSYYHDIGKTEKPEYFIENQMDSKNLHSKLKPNMSALILASHVKTGLEMAEEYKLPKRIRDFIAEHHGTSIMHFFYNKAITEAGEKDVVNEDDFRYPGPKPASRASAIVMLADTVEAATRSLKNPTPTKIRSFVEGLVELKYQDGELSECDLTFKELSQIIEAFLPVLYGVFQHRIEYPDKKDNAKKGSKTKKQPVEKIKNDGN